MKIKKHKKFIVAVLSLTISLVSVITVYAYLSAETGALKNTFIEEINEAIDVSNSGVDVGQPGYAVYVRAAIVVNWQDSSDNVYAYTPKENTDYSFSIDDSKWIKGNDGFYYYRAKINSGTTSPLFTTFSSLTTAPTNYQLHVEIIAQTIQALGSTDADSNVSAVEDAWNVILDSNGNITGVN